MRLERARTSRLRHRLLARKIILFRLLPRRLPARRRVALHPPRRRAATRRARHLGASRLSRFHRPSRPARLRGAAAIGEIDQRIIPESIRPRPRARGDSTRPSHGRHDARSLVVQTRHSSLNRSNSTSRRARPIARSGRASRWTRRENFTPSTGASTVGARASRARVRGDKDDRAEEF